MKRPTVVLASASIVIAISAATYRVLVAGFVTEVRWTTGVPGLMTSDEPRVPSYFAEAPIPATTLLLLVAFALVPALAGLRRDLVQGTAWWWIYLASAAGILIVSVLIPGGGIINPFHRVTTGAWGMFGAAALMLLAAFLSAIRARRSELQ